MKLPKLARRTLLTLAAIVTALIVAAAVTPHQDHAPAPPTAAPVQATTPTPTPTPSTAYTMPAKVVDQLFLSSVRNDLPMVAQVPDGDLLNMAQAVCHALDTGNTTDQLLGVMMQSFPTVAQDTGAKLIGKAMGAYCPQYLAK